MRLEPYGPVLVCTGIALPFPLPLPLLVTQRLHRRQSPLTLRGRIVILS
jgi:hypothetical protein